MCLLRVTNVTRPIISNDIILLKDDAFSRLRDEVYIRVLSNDKRDGEISKSYFYFIVDKLRKMGLLLDNAISFKVVIPYAPDDKGGIVLREGIMYITNKKQLVYFDIYDTTYICGSCPVILSCVQGLKQIAYELGIKIRDDNPNLAWYKILESIQRALLEASMSLKLKLEEIPFGNKVCCEEEVVKENEPQVNL
ncbi:hypothetical protein [Sulfurisphaera tokodaii]|uniref:Uncharacterized protein n=1 Tax=Sulfurisphaera tokodaii (strain DSM 16993 / JCM 10545 / NBRC 100140 / 7) TaxID=273063 RepID=Q970C9_SULTO|nr:hypothetical protein [Sulfurisphaera tokodaii]BAB66744.1 hypothetical protein STK_16630 [Sulfurisphaera tokodaii str. 7]